MFSNYFVVLLGFWAERDSTEAVPVQFVSNTQLNEKFIQKFSVE